jgi:ribonuclease HII
MGGQGLAVLPAGPGVQPRQGARKGGVVSQWLICGVDEAGRGPLAGPVTAAAVILPEVFPLEQLADSKVLSPARRRAAAASIRERAPAWAVGWAWPEEIDRINIHRATLLAMQRAVRALGIQPDQILVDGLFCPPFSVPCTAIVRGDATVPQIMAASILAKTCRDAWMERYARIEPGYGFERHKGYPTEEHRALIRELGQCAIHRRSFRLSPCGPTPCG